MRIRCDSTGHVSASISIDLPLPAITVWGQMRDLPDFATLDPFHHRIELTRSDRRTLGMTGAVSPGIELRLHHRFGPFRLVRCGRILTWHEGQGYSFSDLSQRGVRVGFPHIYQYRVVPTGPQTSRLTVEVRGRWTARWIPVPLRRAWLWFVMVRMRAILRLHGLRMHRARQRRRATAAVTGRN